MYPEQPTNWSIIRTLQYGMLVVIADRSGGGGGGGGDHVEPESLECKTRLVNQRSLVKELNNAYLSHCPVKMFISLAVLNTFFCFYLIHCHFRYMYA